MSGRERGAHPIDRLSDLLLGELSPGEASAALRHIAGCPACARAWADLERAALALPEPGAGVAPPAAARAAVMVKVRGDARGRARRRALAPVGAALLGAAAVASAWLLVAPARPLPPTPGQRVAVLAGAGGSGGDVYVDAALRRVTVRVWHLPPLRRGEVYEVWWVRAGVHSMGGTFGVDRDGDATVTLALPPGWRSAGALGVTAEPDPGTRRPTGPRVVGGTLWPTSLPRRS